MPLSCAIATVVAASTHAATPAFTSLIVPSGTGQIVTASLFDFTGEATTAFGTLDGDTDDLDRVATLATIGNASGGASVYWNIAKP